MKVTDFLGDKFSYSKLNCFSKCPRQAFYRYIRKMPFIVSPWLLFGRAVHGGQEADNYAKLRGERLSIENVLEAAVETFRDEVETENLEKARFPLDPFADEHRRQLEVFEKSGMRDLVVPVAGTVEAGFQLEVSAGDGQGGMRPAIIEGYVDVVSEVGEAGGLAREVVNYKSCARPPTVKEANVNLQLALEAYGSGCAGRKIVAFVKAGKQKPTARSIPADARPPSQLLLQFLGDTIADFRWAVQHDCWPKCDHACNWCGPAVCEFYRLCYPRELDLSNVIVVEKVNPTGSLPPAAWRESLIGRRESEKKGDSK